MGNKRPVSLDRIVKHAIVAAMPDHAGIIYRILVQKLREKGHPLNAKREREFRALAARIAAGEENPTVGSDGKKISLELTSTDIEAFIEKFQNAVTQAITKTIETTAIRVTQAVNAAWKERGKDNVAYQAGIQHQIARQWKVALNRLDLVLEVAEETVGAFGARKRSGQDRRYAKVQWAFLVRAILVSREIRHLIAGGFANGALARWRTLHELDVVAAFIRMHGLNAAERFSAHATIGRHKLLSASRHHYAPAAIRRLDAKRKRTMDAHGDDFGRDYGWAEGFGGLKGANFAALERAVDSASWREQYLLACAVIHVSGVGIDECLGRPAFVSRAAQLAGPSSADLSIPGGMCVRSLVCVFATVLTAEPTVDNLISVKVLSSLGATAIREFERRGARL